MRGPTLAGAAAAILLGWSGTAFATQAAWTCALDTDDHKTRDVLEDTDTQWVWIEGEDFMQATTGPDIEDPTITVERDLAFSRQKLSFEVQEADIQAGQEPWTTDIMLDETDRTLWIISDGGSEHFHCVQQPFDAMFRKHVK